VVLACNHQTESIEIKIDDGRGEESERLAHDQSADDRYAERASQF
jgi:hypothetical protein